MAGPPAAAMDVPQGAGPFAAAGAEQRPVRLCLRVVDGKGGASVGVALREEAGGVVVANPGPQAAYGLRSGHRLVAVGSAPVRSVAEFSGLIRGAAGQQVTVTVLQQFLLAPSASYFPAGAAPRPAAAAAPAATTTTTTTTKTETTTTTTTTGPGAAAGPASPSAPSSAFTPGPSPSSGGAAVGAPRQLPSKPLAAPQDAVGLSAEKRRCTDCPFLLLVAGLLALWLTMAAAALRDGNPLRLIYGTDYLGNVCGQTGASNAPRQPPPELLNGTAWADRDQVWYPFRVDDPGSWTAVSKMGVCVARCPAPGEVVHTYGNLTEDGGMIPPFYNATYVSRERMRRCLPDGDELSEVSSLIDIGDAVYDGFAEIEDARDVVLGALGVAVGLCLLWVTLIRCCAAPVLMGTIVLLFLGAGGGCAGCVLAALDEGGWFWWVAGGLLLLVALFLAWTGVMARKQLRLAAPAVAAAAGDAVASMCSVFLIPFVSSAVLGAWTAACAVTAAYVMTITDDAGLETFDFDGGEVISVWTDTLPARRQIFQVYNAFFWVLGAAFLADIGNAAAAFAGVEWFFSAGGAAEKSARCSTVLCSLCHVLRYHLGSCAIGAFNIAFVSIAKGTFWALDSILTSCARDCLCGPCARCSRAWHECLSNSLRGTNGKTYSAMALRPATFCASARWASELTQVHLAATVSVRGVMQLMKMLGKLLIAAASCAWAYAAIKEWGLAPQVDSVAAPLFVVFVCAWVIATAFLGLFAAVLDAVVVCFCYDNPSADAPAGGAYTPPGLREFVERRAAEHEAAQLRRRQAERQRQRREEERREARRQKRDDDCCCC